MVRYRIVRRKAMIGAGGQSDEVTALHTNADPFVVRVSHVKVAGAGQYEPYLVVGMQMLLVEYLQLEYRERERDTLTNIVLVVVVVCYLERTNTCV